MATRRMFPHDPVRITFTKDFRQLVHGDLRPGRDVTIDYDAERLANERSKDGWTIKCFYRFVEDGEVWEVDLEAPTGEVLTKLTNEPGEGTMMQCKIQVPQDTDHLTVWFLNTGKSGAQYWDTNLGKNYVFRFVVDDIEVDSVGVEPEAGGTSKFHIEVLTAPEVEEFQVLYRIMNDPNAPKDQDSTLPLERLESGSTGRRRWAGSTAVPNGAVVRFTMRYKAYGNFHADTNSDKGYLTWTGAERNREAGVL